MNKNTLIISINQLMKDISQDRYIILNESELQSRIFNYLTEYSDNDINYTVPRSVTFPDEHRSGVMRQRAYREIVLNPKLGRISPRPDIVIYTGDSIIAVSKENGAISSWESEEKIIVETKFNVGNMSLLRDENKYAEEYRLNLFTVGYDSMGSNIKCVSDNRYLIGGLGEIGDGREWEFNNGLIGDSIHEVWLDFQKCPAKYLREKDFESRLTNKIENRIGFKGCKIVNDGKVVGFTTSVRNQISTSVFGKRRHDILIVESLCLPKRIGKVQDVVNPLLEIEIKTSHSNSHNWFRGRLDDELSKMCEFNQLTGCRPIFLLFRFGKPIFVNDYKAMTKKYPLIDFMYLCSNGESV